MICSKCGNSIPDDSKFCVLCGNKMERPVQNVGAQAVPPSWCTSCGAQLRPGAAFCAKCGARQGVKPQQAAAPVQQAAAPVQQPQQPTAPVQQPAAPVQQPAAPAKKKSKAPLVILGILLFILLLGGVGVIVDTQLNDGKIIDTVLNLFGGGEDEDKDEDADEAGDKDEDGSEGKESGESKEDAGEASDKDSQSSQAAEKGDVTLLDPAKELADQAKTEFDAGNLLDGAIPHCAEALQLYASVAETANLQEEAQEALPGLYTLYLESMASYADTIIAQGAYAAGLEQITSIWKEAAAVTDTLTAGGYTVDSKTLYDAYAVVLQTYRDMYIESINGITGYENWSRDEAWNYADAAYSVKEGGKPVLFDMEDLDDPLRMRYVYCLARITQKRCETGINDGTLSQLDAVNNIVSILKDTDYNPLLLQDIINYGKAAGLDVKKYQDAYDAIVKQIQTEQNFTVGSNVSVNSVSSVNVKSFWYFNDLDGEDKYKVDTYNGTTAATREWIRSNVPVILGE